MVVCDSEVIEEMARQLLASMEQEPVSYTCSDALDDVYCGSAAMMGARWRCGRSTTLRSTTVTAASGVISV
ncbi:hypothetical protein KZ770_18720 [Escherichia coli]|nr:hypothetical protein [Escherichia coli]